MPVKKLRWAVYPAPWAGETLGGDRAPYFNRAIECWAAVLERAATENDQQLHRTWWKFLAEILRTVRPDPRDKYPGPVLSNAIRGLHAFDGTGHRFFQDAEAAVDLIASVLGELPYEQAWAVVWAVQWYWDHREFLSEGDEWWTQRYRTEFAKFRSRRPSATSG